MSLRFFADHCVSNAVMRTLQEAGHEVLRLRDHIPVDSPDDVVMATAQRLGAVLVSLDGDFSDIVSYPPADYIGIIALQVRNHPDVIPALMSRLLDYFALHSEMTDYEGKLLLVEAHRIRIRT